MSPFKRISEQVQSIDSRLNSLRRESIYARMSPAALEVAIGEVDASAKELNRCISHLSQFHDILMQLDNGLTLSEAITQALQSIWQKIPLSYGVIILGEAELGPYYYQAMLGIEKSADYLGKECAFPLSGVLAQTLLRKMDPTSADHLCINDIRAQMRPTVAEFPWLPMHGSILILPLRLNNHSLAKGVLVVGRSVQGGFSDQHLRDEFEDIAKNLAHLIYSAQIRLDLTKQTEQLVNVQLITREIARAQSVEEVLQILTQKMSEVISHIDVEVYLRNVEAIYDPLIDPNEPSLYLYENNLYDNNSGITKPLSTQKQDMFAWTMRVGEPIFYHPTRLFTEPEHPYYSVSGPAMVVPIGGKEYTFGVIHVLTRNEMRQFDETDTLLMRSIANSVAVALKSVDLDLGKAQSQISSLQTLISIAEEQSRIFSGHSQRVTHNASLVARRLGMDDTMWSNVRAAAALHNVCILIQPAVERADAPIEAQHDLQNQVALSSSLLRQMGIHSAIANLVEMLAHSYSIHQMFNTLGVDALPSDGALEVDAAELFSEVSRVGTGYCSTHTQSAHRNLGQANLVPGRQNAMLLGAQIICLVDMFDTWLCTASRRQTHSLGAQLHYLSSQSGVTLDPQLVIFFQTLLSEDQLQLPNQIGKKLSLQPA